MKRRVLGILGGGLRLLGACLCVPSAFGVYHSIVSDPAALGLIFCGFLMTFSGLLMIVGKQLALSSSVPKSYLRQEPKQKAKAPHLQVYEPVGWDKVNRDMYGDAFAASHPHSSLGPIDISKPPHEL